MSIWGDMGQLAGSAWDGKASMWGDLAAVGMDLGGMIAPKGLLPDGKEARDWTNELIGADPKEQKEGNMGNHIGAILGGAAGFIGGPGAMAIGAALGSAAGGWISDMFGGDDEQSVTATKSPHAAPANPALGPALVGSQWQQGKQGQGGGLLPPKYANAPSPGLGSGWGQLPFR